MAQWVRAAARCRVRGLIAGLIVFSFFSAPQTVGARSGGGTWCPAGYSYSGVYSDTRLFGVSATIRAHGQRVANGHIAAYVNVGTEKRWLQIGVNTTDTASSRTQRLYYELHRPGEPIVYRELGEVAPGTPVRVAVVAVSGHPGTWRLYVDGRLSSLAVLLPGSKAGLLVSASAENFQRAEAHCNAFRYEF